MFSTLSKIHNFDFFMCFFTRVSIGYQKIQMLERVLRNIFQQKSGFPG